jgi:hypothetical protein
MSNEDYWKRIASDRLTYIEKLKMEILILGEHLDPLEIDDLLEGLPLIQDIWYMVHE